eukprot:COSAG01_NODE_17788_length_1124_cov_1.239024_1_plen_143_part_10
MAFLRRLRTLGRAIASAQPARALLNLRHADGSSVRVHALFLPMISVKGSSSAGRDAGETTASVGDEEEEDVLKWRPACLYTVILDHIPIGAREQPGGRSAAVVVDLDVPDDLSQGVAPVLVCLEQQATFAQAPLPLRDAYCLA